MRLFVIFTSLAMLIAHNIRAEDRALTVFAAGSLREAFSAIAKDFGAAHKIQVRTEFGPSGRMRERMEHGEQADLFASADIGHARTFVEDGRAVVMAMFARNSICVLAPEQLGLAEATVVPKLLDRSTRIGISTPKIDPLGDYTVELYSRIARSHAGEAQNLMERSTVIETPPAGSPPPSRDAFADALREGRVDLAIVYCSGRDRYTRLLPKAALVSLPPEFQVGPEYALAYSRTPIPSRPNSPSLCCLRKGKLHWHDPGSCRSGCQKPTAKERTFRP